MKDKIRTIASFFTHSFDAPTTRRRRGWSIRLIWRYTLLQIPALALLVITLIVIEQWVDLPAWFTWGLVTLWVIKDVALLPLTWRAYDWDHAGEANSMVGRQGVVQERLSPMGSVRVRGELWQARLTADGSPVDKGAVVQVREIRGLTLLVEQVTEKNPPTG